MAKRKTLGEQFRQRRQEMKLSQDEASAKCGVLQKTISDIEQGKGNPTLASIEAYARCLKKRLTLAD